MVSADQDSIILQRPQNFPEALRMVRERFGVSLGDFARQMNTPIVDVSGVETGRTLASGRRDAQPMNSPGTPTRKAPDGRADTDEKKRAIVERVFAAWTKDPQLRLGQLLVNSLRRADVDQGDLFYVEDESLAVDVESFSRRNKP